MSQNNRHAKLANFMMMLGHAPGRGLIVFVTTLIVVVNFVINVAAEAQESALPTSLANQAPPASPAAPDKSPNPAPIIPQTTLGQAQALVHKGDYGGAILKYQQLLQEKPKSPDAYAGLTRAYLKQHDVDRAYETASRGLQVNDSWAIRVALGEVYFRQGKIPEAEKEWIAVINSGYPAARAYLGVARVRWAIEMNKAAKAMIDKAHALDQQDPDIQNAWIGTLPRAEAIQYYEKFLADNSGAEERGDIESYLSYLKERAKEHDGNCRLASTVTHTETPLVRLLMDPSHLRGYGLSVQINGIHTNIMLDTGASGILVKRSTAERAGITKIVASNVWGVGDKGAKNTHIGFAKTIRIGELEFQDCPVEVMESRNVAGEDGLIGADVFENFLVDIDFPKEMLRLSELPKRPGEVDERPRLASEEDDSEAAGEKQAAAPPEGETVSDSKGKNTSAPPSRGPKDRYIAPEMANYSHVYRFGHDLLVPTKIGDVTGKLFLLDTGSLTNAISPQAAREVTKVHGDADTRVSGISGSVDKVYSANKAVLQFGNLRQENQDMMSFDMTHISESNGTEVSGFFGFVLLRFLDIKIDYRDALVDFSYDRNRFGR